MTISGVSVNFVSRYWDLINCVIVHGYVECVASLPCFSGWIDACLASRKEKRPLYSNLIQIRYMPPCLFELGVAAEKDKGLVCWCVSSYDSLMC